MANNPPAGDAGGSPRAAPPVGAAPRERFVLDSAHVGDIQGAFGTIRQHEQAHRTVRSRSLALLAIIGPGLIVMVGDNDAGGVATYSQAGQNYGTSLMWVLLLLVPVLIVNQEMVVRLGAVTGVGHARLINERFGRFWGWFSVGDLFVLNFLTIVTEFIGVSLSLGYLGVSKYLAVPIAAAALVAITASGSFRFWERSMFMFVFANVLVIPLFIIAHPHVGQAARDFVVPGIQGGATSTSVLLIIAMVGTTVAPWQLFFQQSNIIDKRITPRWINYERLDTYIGAVVVVIGAAALIGISAFAFTGTPYFGHFTDAGGTISGLDHALGSTAAVFFAIVLLNASLIGAGALTLSTSYAFGDVTGTKSSLHRSFSDARTFYLIFACLIAGAAAIVLIPGAPLGVITEAVQALAGVLLPSASVFLLLLCNDREVLGPWRNTPWINALASVIVAVLVLLSLILMATTIFPSVDVTTVSLVGGAVLAAGLLAFAAAALRARAGAATVHSDNRRTAARRTYAAALATARAERDRALAAAKATRKQAEATALGDYAAAVEAAGDDAVARTAAKGQHGRAGAEARADCTNAEAMANTGYTLARAVARADRDNSLAAADAEARTWTMPPLALLGRPEWSTGRKVAMLALRGYLVISVILLVVKAVQLGGG